MKLWKKIQKNNNIKWHRKCGKKSENCQRNCICNEERKGAKLSKKTIEIRESEIKKNNLWLSAFGIEDKHDTWGYYAIVSGDSMNIKTP